MNTPETPSLPLTQAEPVLLDENRPIYQFSTLSESELLSLSHTYAPTMSLADLRICQALCRKERRAITYAMLRMFDMLIAERKTLLSHRVLTEVNTDTAAVAETYHDMMVKFATLYPTRKIPPTLSEAAQISGLYMKRIGRGDERLPFCSRLLNGEEVSDATPVLHRENGAPLLRVDDRTQKSASTVFETGTAFVLISPKDASDEADYEGRLAAFLADPDVASWHGETLRVGRFGLLGTLAERSRGIFADISLLPRMPQVALCLTDLITAHRGRMLLTATRLNAAHLCEAACRFDLHAAYFAKTTESGRWFTTKNVSPSLDLALDFLHTLMHGKDAGKVITAPENLKTAYPSLSLDVRGSIEADTYLLSPVCREIRENYFSQSLNTAIDAILMLVSQGVDRRSIALSCAYRFPKDDTSDAEALGKCLSVLLGTYRVAMELAAPERDATICYTDEPYTVACTAYACKPSAPIPTEVTHTGTRLGYLSFRRFSDGTPDFASLREMCDRFCELVGRGLVFSARPVSGELRPILAEMTEGVTVQYTNDAESILSLYGQGILLETTQIRGFDEIGRTLAIKKAEVSDDAQENM